MTTREIVNVKIKADFSNGLWTRWYDLQTDDFKTIAKIKTTRLIASEKIISGTLFVEKKEIPIKKMSEALEELTKLGHDKYGLMCLFAQENY